jgi:hypothetical protein
LEPSEAVLLEKAGGKGWIDTDQLILGMWAMEGMLAFQSEMTSFRIEVFPAKVVVANWLLGGGGGPGV